MGSCKEILLYPPTINRQLDNVKGPRSVQRFGDNLLRNLHGGNQLIMLAGLTDSVIFGTVVTGNLDRFPIRGFSDMVSAALITAIPLLFGYYATRLRERKVKRFIREARVKARSLAAGEGVFSRLTTNRPRLEIVEDLD